MEYPAAGKAAIGLDPGSDGQWQYPECPVASASKQRLAKLTTFME